MKVRALKYWFVGMALIIAAQLFGLYIGEDFITMGDIAIMGALLGIALKVDEKQ